MGSRPGFAQLQAFYEDHLRNQVMPFWTENCIDWDNGGINNMVNDEGTILSTDKFMWSQGRALWTFSALYNHLDRDSRWLEIADNIADFVMNHGRDTDGAWAFRLHADGSVAEPPKSVYVDAFIIYGLTEYARATGNRRAIEIARETCSRVSPPFAFTNWAC